MDIQIILPKSVAIEHPIDCASKSFIAFRRKRLKDCQFKRAKGAMMMQSHRNIEVLSKSDIDQLTISNLFAIQLDEGELAIAASFPHSFDYLQRDISFKIFD